MPPVIQPPGPAIDVVLVAGDGLVLAGLVSLLAGEEDLRIIQRVGRADDVRASEAVVVLCDRAGDGDRQVAAHQLATRNRVLLVFPFDEPCCPVAALTAGASGVVSSLIDGVRLRRAVRVVASGGIYLSAEVAAPARDRFDQLVAARPAATPALAPRELETLRWVAGGYTHAQAARRMRVSPGTVNTYVKRLRLKLNAANKAQLTRRAAELGLLARSAVDGAR